MPIHRNDAIGRRCLPVVSLLILVPLLSACTNVSVGGTRSLAISPADHAPIRVVAAENFWGSIAEAIGGRLVVVFSIIANPTIDPHSYEPTANDAKKFAGADLALVNGLGYDPWAEDLLAADNVPVVVNVGEALHLTTGANPHRWYNPGDVAIIADDLVTKLSALDPKGHATFVANEQQFLVHSLSVYNTLRTKIRAQFAGVHVGASESIFSMLAPSLGLDLVTPPTFLRAISEGGEVSAADLATIDHQITTRSIWVYVYNSQNNTPEITNQLALCAKEHIPVVAISETLDIPNHSYATWQTDQLGRLYRALLQARSQR